MKLSKVVTALVPVALLAGGGAAYLTRSAPGAVASIATPSPAKPASSPSPVKPSSPVKPPSPVKPSSPVKPVVVIHSAPAARTASDKFNNWSAGKGGTLLENDFGILSQTQSDAAARNVAAIEADASALIAAGDACLADPPPSDTATWDAAFAAQVQAGQDLEARNLAGAEAEASIVKADIYAFNSQTS